MSSERFFIPTYIGSFDKMLSPAGKRVRGGLPTQAVVTIEGTEDAELFVFQIMKNYVQKYVKNKKVIEAGRNAPITFVTLEETSKSILNLIKNRIDWDEISYFEKYDDFKRLDPEKVPNEIKYIYFYDAYNWKTILSRQESQIIKLREEQIKDYNLGRYGGFLIFYTLSKLSMYMSEGELLEFINSVGTETIRGNFTAIFMLDPSLHDEKFLRKIRRLSDLTIILDAIERDYRINYIKMFGTTIKVGYEGREIPYLKAPGRGIYLIEDIKNDLKKKKKIFNPGSLGGKREKLPMEDYLLTGLDILDLSRPIATGEEVEEGYGIKISYSYGMIYKFDIVTMYKILFRVIESLIDVSNSEVLLIDVDDSPSNFLYFIDKLIVDDNIKNKFINYIKSKRLKFVDCTYSSPEPIVKIGGEIFDVEDIENLSEILYYVKTMFMGERKDVSYRVVILNSLSGLASAIGKDNAYKFVHRLVNRFIWNPDYRSVLFNLVDERILNPEELTVFMPILDSFITIKGENISGSEVYFFKVSRLPEVEPYTTDWVPTIITDKYPPGVFFATDESLLKLIGSK